MSYFSIPTNKKLGWLVFLIGWLVSATISNIFPEFFPLGLITLLFFVAFVIEIVATVIKKVRNK